MTDHIRTRRCALENSLYGLIAHASIMLKQLLDTDTSGEDVSDRMNVGWSAFKQAVRDYHQVLHVPPAPPPLPPRRPTQEAAVAPDTLQVYRAGSPVASERCEVCFAQLNSQATAGLNPCGHTFHTTCIELWMQRQENCPYCRQAVRSITYNSDHY